jgi:Predicted membrane protein (DUF2254)
VRTKPLARGGLPSTRPEPVRRACDRFDIPLKAISPAVNDPATAISCVDQLSRILIRFASRELPESPLYDPPGVVRVGIPWIDFEGLLNSTFEQIRMYSRTDVGVSLRPAARAGRHRHHHTGCWTTGGHSWSAGRVVRGAAGNRCPYRDQADCQIRLSIGLLPSGRIHTGRDSKQAQRQRQQLGGLRDVGNPVNTEARK